MKNLEENKNKNEKNYGILEEKIKKLEKENEDIKNGNIMLRDNLKKQNNEIHILKEEMKLLKINKERFEKIQKRTINSIIMNENEFNFIENEIKNKMNKEIKEIKKLYQATIDGGEPNIFHIKCDNIPNTLTLIKSLGNRRFGGFTLNSWDCISEYKADQNAFSFLFSLDKKEVYPIIKNNTAIYCNKKNGPTFGGGWDIWVEGNVLKINGLTTYKCSYEHNGDFIEVYYSNKTKALDIEVYQIIFEEF